MRKNISSPSALVQFEKAFKNFCTFCSTQAFWVCFTEADEGPLSVGVASFGVLVCEPEDEA